IPSKGVPHTDPTSSTTNGDTETAPPIFPQAITRADNAGTQVTMPRSGGTYRLFAYVHDNHGGAAVANIPLQVKGGAAAPSAAVTPATAAKLPFVVYDEADRNEPVYIPSGYMGTTAAIKMNERCTQNPHSGKTCL